MKEHDWYIEGHPNHMDFGQHPTDGGESLWTSKNVMARCRVCGVQFQWNSGQKTLKEGFAHDQEFARAMSSFGVRPHSEDCDEEKLLSVHEA